MHLDDLLFTLEICRKHLPLETHPVHYDRLRRIQSILIFRDEEIRNEALEQDLNNEIKFV